MSAPACKECKFYKERARDGLSGDSAGECRARPPVVDQHHDPVLWPDGGASAQPMFPFVVPLDWCGAFRKREI